MQREDYAGIDIDYEDLQASDRTAFTTFITQLAGALHVAGKMLSVDLFAKSSDRGYDQRNLAQDYQAIGRVADQVRLMGYDYHWASSGPGPVAPISWIRAVLSYAKTQIPAGKIILGVPLYGYDWSGGHGTPVSWLQAFQLSGRYGVRPQFDAASQSPWFAYTDAAGRRHVVWFENGPSTRPSSRRRKTPGSAASTSGSTAWRIRASGPRCGRPCRTACLPRACGQPESDPAITATGIGKKDQLGA